jgi:hypothetical protein
VRHGAGRHRRRLGLRWRQRRQPGDLPLRAALKTGALVALLALGGCLGCDSVPPDALTRCDQGTILPGTVATDILFVVDDSGSMAAEQSRLATAFGDFIASLSASAVANDFQIGVTTTAVDLPVCEAYDGAGACTTFSLRTTYDDGTPYAAGALVAAAGRPAILRAGSATLVDDFIANVQVGTQGPSKEQGLRAMRQALDGRNTGFLRPGARLAVVLVSDEDDCSDSATAPGVVYPRFQDSCHSDALQARLPPVQDFVDALRGPLGGEVRSVKLGILAGLDAATGQPAQPSCNADGYPGYRYRLLAEAFGADAVVADVCQPDFTATLTAIAQSLDPGQTVPLAGEPADWRLLQVGITRADGTQDSCRVGVPGTPASEAQAIYQAPQAGSPPRITFQGACLLRVGDSIQIRVVCAG